jgi:hypothetical protein
MEEKITIFSNEFEYEYLTGDEEIPGVVVIRPRQLTFRTSRQLPSTGIARERRLFLPARV